MPYSAPPLTQLEQVARLTRAGRNVREVSLALRMSRWSVYACLAWARKRGLLPPSTRRKVAWPVMASRCERCFLLGHKVEDCDLNTRGGDRLHVDVL